MALHETTRLLARGTNRLNPSGIRGILRRKRGFFKATILLIKFLNHKNLIILKQVLLGQRNCKSIGGNFLADQSHTFFVPTKFFKKKLFISFSLSKHTQ